jgi:L,D-peptidoglycan transpeptidase YkuD (ErfK/YbiS/YcfS/YnhG family)
MYLLNDYKPTNGCIAIDVNDFIEILALLDTNEKINIS